LANKQVQIKNLKERKQESVEFEKAVFKLWGKKFVDKIHSLFIFIFLFLH
jgi:hypothetical protein